MKIIYMGTPDFAVYPLRRLLETGHNVVGVVTNPDKPAGRGQKIQESAVKQYAREKGIKILQPENFKDEHFLQELRDIQPDLNIVVAFKMLPEVVWDMPRLGTINLHASLLPHYRGAAPINRVIMNGESYTGVSTFLLNKGMDMGKILYREQVEIGEDMTAGELHDALMERGAELLIKTVDAMEGGDYPLIDQRTLLEGKEPIQAPKIFKEEMKIAWNKPTISIYNHIRGLSPYPAAWTELKNTNTGEIFALKIYQAEKEVKTVEGKPGDIWTDGKTYFFILTSDGLIKLKDIQLSGKKKMEVDEFLRGFRLQEYRINP